MDLPLNQALEQAVIAHNQGRIQEAMSLYHAILRVQPTHPDASHNLGLIAISHGRSDLGLPLFKNALDVNSEVEQFWISYIDALIKEKQFNNAKKMLELARKKGQAGELFSALEEQVAQQNPVENFIKASPSQQQLDTLFDYYQNGQFDKAEKLAIYMTQESPEYPFGYKILGSILGLTGRTPEAISANQKTIELSPQDADAHSNLGATLQEAGRLDEAEAACRQAIALNPDLADAHRNLGNTFFNLDRLSEAEASLMQSLALDADSAESHSSLGIVLNAIGAKERALHHFSINLQIKRGLHPANLYLKIFRQVSKAKLEHDIDQFQYLANSGYDVKRFHGLARLYRKIKLDINYTTDTDSYLVSDEHQRLLENSYNRPIHLLQAPAVEKSALGGSIDVKKITEDYLDHEFGITYFDDLLSPTALKSLREFLLGSTIWYDVKYKGSYMGAYLSEGLASPLILQIADDLKTKLPKIFKNHHVTHIWAYKYDNRACEKNNSFKGINVHADFAAINVNFWITPNTANLDPTSGGLIVYDSEAPLDWDFSSYNSDEQKIRAEIKTSGQKKTVIPHNENRVVIFNSSLFHETDKLEFKAGYENRRINVTILFGRRQ